MSQFKRDVINKMIDKQVKDMNELGEVRFNLKLELSDVEQLREYLKELENNEEYEKCAKVLKKISK
jgi:protein-arginine kinase activator protein McsA